MSRAQRLLDLIQLLRSYRYAVKGETLADELGVSLRTVYRDIQTLQSQGAPIEGEAGVGYVLKPGFTIPPLMFTVEEIEALVLGASWVADRGDSGLAKAARHILTKVKSVLPPALKRDLESTTLIVGPAREPAPVNDETSLLLRKSIREETKLEIAYRDERGSATVRTVWPFALGYFDSVLMLMAWCEKRLDFRNFRADRIGECRSLGQGYGESRENLLDRWRQREGLERSDLLL